MQQRAAGGRHGRHLESMTLYQKSGFCHSIYRYAYFLEKQFCPISSRYDLKQRSLVRMTYAPETGAFQAVAAILWGSWGPDPLTFWQCGVQVCTDPPLFSAMLLYVACNP